MLFSEVQSNGTVGTVSIYRTVFACTLRWLTMATVLEIEATFSHWWKALHNTKPDKEYIFLNPVRYDVKKLLSKVNC